MFHRFERVLQPTSLPPGGPPQAQLIAFYWHYAKQARRFLAALFVLGSAAALLDIALPLFIGRVTGLVAQNDPASLLRDHWGQLAGMALVLVVARPLVFLTQNLVTNQILTPGLTNLTRWQNHWHVVRQSWSFFQNDFAGRIAGRVVHTGVSLRESVVSSTNSMWHVLVYGTSAILLASAIDLALALPLLVWFCCFAALLWFFVPRMRDRSRLNSEARSALTGRIVDSYSNILTVKLFARAQDEDQFVREAVDAHTEAFRDQQRLNTSFAFLLSLLNGSLITATGAVAIALWTNGVITVGMVAAA
jgi:ATP-binding cassette subfamily B multidrug efflux pump